MIRTALCAAAAQSLLLLPIQHASATSGPPAAPAGFLLIEHSRRAAAPVTDLGVPDAAGRGALEQSKRVPMSRPFGALIDRAELRHGLPRGLLDALIAIESGHGWWRVSPAGAAGLTQLMPATAAELGVTNRFDPAQSVDGGARYLRLMLDRFGSVALALAAYNAGPGAVDRAGGIPENGETPGFVAKVLRAWARRGR